jgi:hypothetical protein
MNVFICKDCQKERWDDIRKSHIGPQGDFIMDSIFSVYKREGNKHLLIGLTELDEEAEVLTIYPVDEKAIRLLIGHKGALTKALKNIIKFRVAINEEYSNHYDEDYGDDDNEDGDDEDYGDDDDEDGGSDKKPQWHKDESNVWALEESLLDKEYKRR